MKIIKPNRSVVENNQRKISIGATATQNGRNQYALDFLEQDERFFIAQWISALDKIFPKPQNKKPTKEIENAREELGKAFVALWKEKKFKEINNYAWCNKVHPYQKQNQICTNKFYKSYWYKQLVGKDVKLENIDYQKVANNVYKHLYEKQVNTHNQKSFIKNRAISISNNAHRFKVEDNFLKSLSIDQQRYIKTLEERFNLYERPKEYKLEDLIKLLNDKQEENYKIGFKNVAKCLYEHYGNIFGKDTKIKEVLNTEHKKHKLLLYHFIIKAALEQQYPKHTHPNKQFREITPEYLHKIATSIEKNKMMAFAIRLGKVIHYDNKEDGLGSIDKLSQIANSSCWTSANQTTIKQKEAFVLQWLNALSAANSTLNNLINPNSNTDLFYSEAFKKALDNIAPDINTRVQLLFGNSMDIQVNQVNKFLIHLHTTISHIRNASFHFKDEDIFKKALSEKHTEVDKQQKELVKKYVEEQFKEQKKLLIASLESAHIETYLKQEQADAFLEEINNNENKFVLPKFSKLLLRAKNNNNLLIEPYNQIQQQAKPYKNCQFVLLKKLYESSFDNWLEEQNISTINQFITTAKEHTTKKAQQINQKNALKGEDIASKAQKEITDIAQEQSLMQYFSDLTAKTASLFAIKKHEYESDDTKSRDQADFVNNFKMDFLALAFKQYLKERKLDFLLSLKKEQRCKINQNLLTGKQELQTPWIYIILHLMPANFVNSLSLQIKKYHILKGEIIFKDVAQAIDLYLSMHNAICQDTTLKDDIQLKEFYKDKKDFTELFTSNNKNIIPVKGLRELLRFGNVELLKNIFKNNEIKHTQIQELQKIQENIADYQQQKANLHQELAKLKPNKRNKQDLENLENYQECLRKVEQYNHLKNHIYLINHQKIHQLIVNIVGRFVGFAQLWERDLYFVMLSILALRNIKLESKFNDGFLENIKKGQISTAFNTIYSQKEKAKKDEKKLYQALDYLFFMKENCQIRNDFAHFNDLHKNKINLTEMLNKARKLMHYDRKLKNAVVKSVKNIIKKDNLNISFKLVKEGVFYNAEFKDITSDEIKHFNNEKIKEKLNGKKYVKAVEKLFKKSDNAE